MVTKRRRSLLVGATVGLVSLLVVLAPRAADAQAVTTGTVEVQVADETGGLLPGVTLTLIEVDTGATRNGVVGERGTFRFLNVPLSSNYQLRAELDGFTTQVIDKIGVEAGSTRSFRFTMKIGGIKETVLVHAERLLVDTKSSETKETMDSGLAGKAPLMGRNHAELASLFPGVLQTAADNSPTFTQFHVRGQGTTGNGYRQDGADVLGPYLGRAANTLSPNSIERMEFVSGGMAPEYGEQPGGIFNIITKSGSNAFSGAYSFLYRDDRFNSETVSGIAGQVEDSAKGDTHFEEAVFGGPVVRDKVFFFVSYQFRREAAGNILSHNIRTGDHHNVHTKFNYNQGPNDQWVIQLDGNTGRQKNNNLSSTVSAESQGGQNFDIIMSSLSQTHQFSPVTVLESQAMYFYLAQTAPIMDRSGNPNVTTVSSSGSWTSGQNSTFTGWTENRVKGGIKLTRVASNHTFKFGADYSYSWGDRFSIEEVRAYTDRRPIGGTLTRTENIYASPFPLDDRFFDAYAQDQWTRGPLTLQYGLRTDYQKVAGDFIVQPRGGVSYDATGDGRNKLSASWGIMHQVVPGTAYSVGILDVQRLYRVTAPIGSLTGTETLQSEFRNTRLGKLKNPKTYAGTVSYERALPLDSRMTATFAWSQIRDQQIATRYSDRIEYQIGGKTDYKGLELSLRKYLSKRFQMLASYTLSRTEGDTPSTLTLLQAPFRYARMDWDSPHASRVTASYLLPRNVDISAVVKYLTGRPYAIDNAQSGVAEAYVDKDGKPAGRNIYRMSNISSVDLALAKDIRTSSATIRPTVQILNLTNAVNVVAVQSVFTAQGRPSRVDLGRQVQFGVDIRF